MHEVVKDRATKTVSQNRDLRIPREAGSSAERFHHAQERQLPHTAQACLVCGSQVLHLLMVEVVKKFDIQTQAGEVTVPLFRVGGCQPPVIRHSHQVVAVVADGDELVHKHFPHVQPKNGFYAGNILQPAGSSSVHAETSAGPFVGECTSAVGDGLQRLPDFTPAVHIDSPELL